MSSDSVKVAIHQPQYWPWPPYIYKVMSADVFVYLDSVQFSKNGFQNRNQIKTPKGSSWLTAPVKHDFGQSLTQTKISDPRALQKHFKTLAVNYAGTPGFRRWRDELQSLLDGRKGSLGDVAIASTEWMLDKLEVQAIRLKSSEIPGLGEHGSRLIAEICNYLGADYYLTGVGALAYMEQEDFSRINCQVWVQEWTGLTYEQAHPEAGYIPNLSTLDLLLNCPETAAGLIRSSGSWKLHSDAA